MFEAARTGNLTKLKELKANGSDLSQQDKDGNTPLLWAACYGHLDVVKWLLKEDGGQSNITEKNKAGNTALLLAVAYSHLEVVQWLLREGGAKLTEINTLENLPKQKQTSEQKSEQKSEPKPKPILVDVNSNQLAIVDHLIRYYHLETDVKLDFTSKSKSIDSYLQLTELLSQTNGNYSEIYSFLDSASTQLKANELNFLHLICLWIDISYQSKQSSYAGIITEKLCIEHLLPSHKIELISHMFRKGCVLNDQPIGVDKPVPRGLLITDGQKETIDIILKQSESDPHLGAIDSESEKLEFFNSYYLIPLYRSITYALQIGDTIENVLRAPFTYHVRANKEPIIDADVAKSTAYHSCLAVGYSQQQHLEVYARTTGKSRLGYYEIVEKYLSDTDLQKITLLLTLGNLPDFNGERLHWVKNYPTWLQKIGDDLSEQVVSEQTPTLKLIELDLSISLKDTVSQIIWDSAKHEPRPSTLPGNHPVYRLQEGVYCKLYPSLPGINDALHYLYRRVFCAVSGLPWSASGLLTIDNQTIPVLLSKNVGSPIDADDRCLNKLDPYTSSKLILFTILTNTEDGKCENHAVLKNARGLFDIYSVDNDQALVDATSESGWVFKTKKLSVKSILFCLNAMNTPLDKKAVDELLILKPADTITAWLGDLIRLDEQYDNLFKECRDSHANEANLYRRSYLKMVLPVATLLSIAYKLEQLQKILKEDSNTSPLTLLRKLEPEVASYYELVLKKNMSPIERFDALVKEEKLYGWCEQTKNYSTTITSSKDIFESLVPDNQPDVVTPKLALDIFENLFQNWDMFKQEHVRLMLGEIAYFSQLPLQEQQILIKLTRLNQFNSLKRNLLLKTIASQPDFTELYLNYPEDTLSDSWFKNILANKSVLTCLSVTNATALTSLMPINGLQSLTKLRLSQLPEVKEFNATLPMLTELTIRDNSQLTKVSLNAPRLRRLRLVNCKNFTFLDLPESLKLEDVTIQNCDGLPLATFYHRWPGFISRWSDVPLIFRQRLANYISQFFINPMSDLNLDLTNVVYGIVTTYLDGLRLLCQMLDKKAHIAFTSTIALAYLGYTIPRVTEILIIGLKHFDSLNLNATGEAICALPQQDALIIQKLEQMLQYTGVKAQIIVAAKVLSTLQVKNKQVIDKLVTFIEDEEEDKSVRLASAKALVTFQVEHPKINRALLMAALYGDAVTRKDAIDFLFSMGIKTEVIVKFFLEGLNHDHYSNRVSAAKAFTSLQRKETYIVQALIKALNDTDWPVRKAAAKALGSLQIVENYVVQELMKTALNDKDKDVCIAANNACSALQKKNELDVPEDKIWTVQALLSSLRDKNSTIRRDVVNAVRTLEIRDEIVIHTLLKMFGDDTFEVRQAAAKAFVACIQKPEDFLKPKFSGLITLLENPKKENNLSAEIIVFREQQKNDNPAIKSTDSIIASACTKDVEKEYVLENCVIDKNSLVIENTIFDEKHAIALEQLLEKNAFEICLKSQNSVIENNKIYFELNDQGMLQYSVNDQKGEAQSGLIEKLDDKLTAPLTLDQLKSIPTLLNTISNNGHIPYEIHTLSLKKVRFTKEYQLLEKHTNTFLVKNILYVTFEGNSIQYTVLNPFGEKVTGIISSAQIAKWKDYKLLKDLSSLKSQMPHILEITSGRGHTFAECETKGYGAFLSLLNKRFLLPNLQALHLQDCDLYDEYDLDLLYPILAQRTTLKQLNLDCNQITRKGLSDLLRALFKEDKSKSKLQILSVCFNKIELASMKMFNELTLAARPLVELQLKGNMIADDDQNIKITHKYRVDAVAMLFDKLSTKDPNFTIASFLTATDMVLTSKQQGEYLLRIFLPGLRDIEVILNDNEVDYLDKLCFSINEKTGERKPIFPRPTTTEQLGFLIAGINPMKLPSQLKDSLLATTCERKKTSKQLLKYHPTDKIKGLLVTHSIFKSPRMEEQPSFLFPEAKLTVKTGWVYFIANKYKFSGAEHSMLAYEYLTNYGQRVFKVAHLQHETKDKRTYIKIESEDLTILIPRTINGRIIARYQVDTKKLKCMHKSIQDDVKHNNLPNVVYQKLIFGSSQTENIMNCLTYCLNKMHEHLKISIFINDTDCLPSTVVQKCIDVNGVIKPEELDSDLADRNVQEFSI